MSAEVITAASGGLFTMRFSPWSDRPLAAGARRPGVATRYLHRKPHGVLIGSKHRTHDHPDDGIRYGVTVYSASASRSTRAQASFK
jgi:hypothetical protein